MKTFIVLLALTSTAWGVTVQKADNCITNDVAGQHRIVTNHCSQIVQVTDKFSDGETDLFWLSADQKHVEVNKGNRYVTTFACYMGAQPTGSPFGDVEVTYENPTYWCTSSE